MSNQTYPKVQYAENVNYWKTGKSSADTWLAKAENEIIGVNGTMLGRVAAFDAITGMDAYMLAFRIGDNEYKLVWPVLKSKGGNAKAARIQAATMLYHDVKAKCVTAKVLGVEKSFVQYLLLPSGVTVAETVENELPMAISQCALQLSDRVLLTGSE